MRRGRRRLLVLLAARGICVDCRSIRVTSDVRILHSDGRQMALSPSSISSFQQCPLLFKMRHIDRKHCTLREMRGAGMVEVKHVATDENTADVFTKILGRQPFEKHSSARLL